MKALVVAADQEQLAELGAELERAGLDTALCSDVADAIRHLADSPPDVVVLHASLGGRASLDVYRVARGDADRRVVFVGLADAGVADDHGDIYLDATLGTSEVAGRVAELVGVERPEESQAPEPVAAAAPTTTVTPQPLDAPRRPRWALIAIIVVLVLLAIMFLQPRIVGGEMLVSDGYHVTQLNAGGAR